MNARTRSLLLPAVLALVAALVAVLAPAASAADYPPPPPKASVSSSPKAGGSVVVSGYTKPLAVVVVTLDSQTGPALYTAAAAQVLGTTTAAADGAYSVSVSIPANLHPGAWFMTVSADGEVLSTMAVGGAAAATGGAADGAATGAVQPSPRTGAQGSQLPVTGSTTSLLVVVGVTLVAAGGSAMAYARRRPAAIAAA